MSERLEFGQRVRINTADVLVRRNLPDKVPAFGWQVFGYNRRKGAVPLVGWMRRRDYQWWSDEAQHRVGIYIGYRTLSDGVKEWLGDEEGYGYTPYASYRVALIVLGERENPVYVFPSDIKDILCDF